MEKSGNISDLRLQVPFELIPAIYEDEVIQLKTKVKIKKKCTQRATTYVADFVYMQEREDDRGGHQGIQDKGIRTEEENDESFFRY